MNFIRNDNIINDYIKYITHQNFDLSEKLIYLYDLRNVYSDFIPDDYFIDIYEIIKYQLEYSLLEETSEIEELQYLFKIALVTSELSKEGILNKFFNSLINYLLLKSEFYIDQYYNTKDSNLLFHLVPTIGDILYNFYNNENNFEVLIKFLIDISGKKLVGDTYIPKFHIVDLNNEFIDKYPEGILPLGMAHGFLRPLIALSKCYSIGYSGPKIKSAILNTFDLYNNFTKIENDNYIWPNFITIDEYVKTDFEKKKKQYRAAWCSGNLSTAFALLKISGNMKWENEKNKYLDIIYKILDKNHEFNLETPILCHGYCSIISYIDSLKYNYNINNDNMIKIKTRFFKLVMEILESDTQEKVIEKYFFGNFSILYGITGSILSLKKENIKTKMIYEKQLMID